MPDAPNKIPTADHDKSDSPVSSANRVVHGSRRRPLQQRFKLPSFHSLIRSAKTLAGWITLLAAIAGVLWGIDFLIERKLSDETLLRKIAAHSRPSLIFDARESIIADMGAVQYIRPEDIRVTGRTPEGWPERIHVGFTRSVSIPPILTSLYDSAQIKAERAKGLDWEFEISWLVEPLSKDDKDRLYRMEIIP